MSLHILNLPDLVIPNGQTESNVIFASGIQAGSMVTSGDGFRDADAIGIFSPDTLPETVTVHVDSSEPAGTNFNPLSRGGADVTLPSGKHVTIDLITFKAIKLVAGATVGGTRTFKLNKSVWV